MSAFRSGGALVRALIMPFMLCCAGVAHADFVVPAGGSFSLNGGSLDLGCGDLTLGGSGQLGSGSVQGVRNVTLQPGSSLDGGAGSIALVGNWSNSGTYTPGSASVAFSDNAACASASSFVGTTAFASLSLISSSGKTFTFPAGLTQSVSSALTILGTATTPLRIVSSTPGQQANLFLASGATQNIQYVSVTDNYGTGQILAPTQHNDGGSGKVRGWFGIPLIPIAVPPQMIPTLGGAGLLLLLGSILGLTAFAPGRRWRPAFTA